MHQQTRDKAHTHPTQATDMTTRDDGLDRRPEADHRRSTASRRELLVASVILPATIAGCVGNNDGSSADDTGDTDDGEGTDNGAVTIDAGDGTDVRMETVISGLDQPWGLTPLPDDRHVMVTELTGGAVLVDLAEETTRSVAGLPDVYVAGQGGLLDPCLHPAFPDEPWVYLTYSVSNDAGESTTAVGRGRLDVLEAELTGFERLYTAEPFVDDASHYGSRCLFGPDGLLYVTVGDRGFKNFGPEHVSQDRTNDLGTTLRLEPDGAVPDDNPFVDDPESRDAIYTYGHRNAQGAAIHPETDAVWLSEHGEQDGDELNVLDAGGNYGWPIAHYGCTYVGGDPVGDRPDERDDVVEPVYHWPCNSGGFPPAGATFYDGDAIPEWHGDFFVGNLAGQYLGRFSVDGHAVEELDPLLDGRGWRIRDVAYHPGEEGLLVIVDDSAAPLLLLSPD